MKNINRILIIDDDLFPLMGHIQLLQSEGYRVETAETGEAGLDLAFEIDPHLILLDIALPGIDGYETCKRLHAENNGKMPYVIMFSAEMIDPSNLIKGFKIGANDYLFKPIQRDVLLARINSVFRMLRAELEKDELISELKLALSEVKILRGLIPICAHCKDIRDDKGYWKQIEDYLLDHSDARFSHGICPDCAKKYYPEMDIYE